MNIFSKQTSSDLKSDGRYASLAQVFVHGDGRRIPMERRARVIAVAQDFRSGSNRRDNLDRRFFAMSEAV